MSAQHTPGPWRVGEMRHGYNIVIRDSDNSPVAFVFVAGYTLKEAKANAGLIAAAPELVAAAQAVIDRWDSPLWKDQPATGEYIARLRVAIAKASA